MVSLTTTPPTAMLASTAVSTVIGDKSVPTGNAAGWKVISASTVARVDTGPRIAKPSVHSPEKSFG